MAARAPVTTAMLLTFLELLADDGGPCFLVGVPQLPAREIAQLCVRVFRLNPLERRQQLVSRRRAKGGRLAAEDDRPVGESWWHGFTRASPARGVSISR